MVLAAGRSRRMGAFKPLLPFGNQTVIESSIANLRAAGANQIIIVVGHRGDEIQEQLASTDVSFAINHNPDSPMASSIALGMCQVSDGSEAVLITPADHPAVPAQTIKSIVKAWEGGAALVQPEYEGRGGHPVLVSRKYFEELRQLDRTSGLRGFFSLHRGETSRLPVNSPFVARDMDTWEDYLALHQEAFGSPPRQS